MIYRCVELARGFPRNSAIMYTLVSSPVQCIVYVCTQHMYGWTIGCKEMSYPLSNDPLKVYYNTILSRVMNHMVVAPRFISPYMSI